MMNTEKNLYSRICEFDNLLLAARKAQKNKRFRTDTARFNVEMEKELFKIRRELQDNTYMPGKYSEFYIYEPKKRMISAAPYRDRVVHHALCNIIEPIYDRTFIHDSYANRKMKGTHRAIKRYQDFCRKNNYVLKCDVKKYFASIDHEILKNEIRRKIGDLKTLQLIDRIIDCSNRQEDHLAYFPGDDLFTPSERRKGLPIGNLTSQFFANIYLNRFDHYIKEKLRCNYYIRYVDDWVIFHNDKCFLHDVRRQAEIYLADYRLKIHPKKSKVFPVDVGLTFLGHRIFPDYRRLKRDNVIRFKRKLRLMKREYEAGRMNWDQINRSVQSWIAHASYADTYHLRKRIFSEYVFIRSQA